MAKQQRTLTITVANEQVHAVLLEGDEVAKEMRLVQPYEEKALTDMLIDFLRDQ